MHVQRLTELRDVLIDFAKKPGNVEFDLLNWITIPDEHFTKAVKRANGDRVAAHLLALELAYQGENFCGTAACAIGLACLVPSFQKQRFYWGVWGPTYIADNGARYNDFDAAAEFFNLSLEDTRELFRRYSYDGEESKNPLAVVDKIIALLEVGEDAQDQHPS